MRILGRHDFFALDSWTRQQYRKRYPGAAAATDRSIARRYRRFGAHRGLALWLDMTRDWHEE
jgi:N-glycosylase/DNA lyase